MSFIKLALGTLGYIVKHRALWVLGALYTISERSLADSMSANGQDLYSYLWCGIDFLGLLATPWLTAGVIKGFQKARSHRKTTLLLLLSETRSYYLRLLGLLAILGIALIVSLYFFKELSNELFKTYPSVEVLSSVIAGVTFLFGYLVYSLIILSQIGIVTQDLGIGSGIRKAWHFFRTQFLQVLAIFVLVTPLSFLSEFIFSLGNLSGAAAVIRGLIYFGVVSLISLLNTGLFTVSFYNCATDEFRNERNHNKMNTYTLTEVTEASWILEKY